MTLAKKQYKYKIKMLYTNSTYKYLLKIFYDFSKIKNIFKKISILYTLQKNGVA